MQYTILARKRATGETKTTQYGTDKGFKAAIAYAQRIYPDFEEFNEWEALLCRCTEVNNDQCEACQVFNIYK